MFSKTTRRENRYALLMVSCTMLLILLFIYSFFLGRYTGLDFMDVPRILMRQLIPAIEKTWATAQEGVVVQLRLPRIVGAIVVGASLAISGAAYQLLFNVSRHTRGYF